MLKSCLKNQIAIYRAVDIKYKLTILAKITNVYLFSL